MDLHSEYNPRLASQCPCVPSYELQAERIRTYERFKQANPEHRTPRGQNHASRTTGSRSMRTVKLSPCRPATQLPIDKQRYVRFSDELWTIDHKPPSRRGGAGQKCKLAPLMRSGTTDSAGILLRRCVSIDSGWCVCNKPPMRDGLRKYLECDKAFIERTWGCIESVSTLARYVLTTKYLNRTGVHSELGRCCMVTFALGRFVSVLSVWQRVFLVREDIALKCTFCSGVTSTVYLASYLAVLSRFYKNQKQFSQLADYKRLSTPAKIELSLPLRLYTLEEHIRYVTTIGTGTYRSKPAIWPHTCIKSDLAYV